MISKYLCNLVVPGAGKSGTSSLHEALNRHPKICMTEQKEPHYFCRPDIYAKGHNYHNSLFPADDGAKFFGESSTGYMIWPDAVEKIAQDLVNPKIILLLRHPVSRTISHWKWRVKLGLESRPLMTAIKVSGHGYDPVTLDSGFGYMSYLQFSEYSKYCPMWVEKFGKKNCLTITTDNLRGDFQVTMSRCFSFLGIENIEFPDEVKVNETKSVVARPAKFMTKTAALLPLSLRKTVGYEKFKHRILRSYTANSMPEVSDSDIKALAECLKKDVEYFEMIKN